MAQTHKTKSVKQKTLLTEWLAVLWVALMVASATATTSYLHDPYSPGMPELITTGLFLVVWAIALWAINQNRRAILRRLGSSTIALLLFFFEIAGVTALRTNYFDCRTPQLRQYFALQEAVQKSDLDQVNTILADDPDPDYTPAGTSSYLAERPQQGNYQRPLYLAVANDNAPIAAALLARGASPNRERTSLLSMATVRGDIPMMQILIQHGAQVNDPDGNSRILCYAVKTNNPAAVKLLLEHGANPNSPSRDAVAGVPRQTLLQAARAKDSAEIVHLLKQAGARE